MTNRSNSIGGRSVSTNNGGGNGNYQHPILRVSPHPAGASAARTHGASACQLQMCNALLCVFGALGLGAAAGQFFAPFALPNHAFMDVRLVLGFLAVLAGCVGCFCVGRHHGSIVIKALYILTLTLALGAVAFYAFTTYRIVTLHQELARLEALNGGVGGAGLAFTVGNDMQLLPPLAASTSGEYVGKIVVGGLSIAIAALIALVATLSVILLEGMLIVERAPPSKHAAGAPYAHSISPTTGDGLDVVDAPQQREARARASTRAQFIVVAVLKLVLGLTALVLAAWTEALRQATGVLQTHFVRVELDQLAALFTLASALTDIHSALTELHQTLNARVSIGIGVVAAVWCAKSVDNNLSPFFRADFNAWTRARATMLSLPHPYGQIVLVHGALIVVLAACSLLAACAAILAATIAARRRPHSRPPTIVVNDHFTLPPPPHQSRYENVDLTPTNPHHAVHTHRHRFAANDDAAAVGCSRALHLLWALCFGALALVGVWGPRWAGDFYGVDLIWMALLALGTALFGSASSAERSATIKFVMNTLALSIAAEKLCVCLNLIYHAATYPAYQNPNLRTAFIGQIVLYTALIIVLAGWTITSICGTCTFGRQVAALADDDEWQHSHKSRRGQGLNCFCALGSVCYGFVMTGSYALFEFARWHFAVVPVDIQIQFFRLANGPLGFAVFIVQLAACCHRKFLLAATLLQVALSAMALFIISPAISNAYYLQALYKSHVLNGSLSAQEHRILVAAIALAGAAAFACMVQLACGVCCILRSSYLLHHNDADTKRRSATATSTTNRRRMAFPPSLASTLPFDEHFGCGTLYRGPLAPTPVALDHHPHFSTIGSYAHRLHHISIRPVEEQTLYWCPDEDPHLFKSTRRVFGRPLPHTADVVAAGAALSSGDERRSAASSAANSQRSRVATTTPDNGDAEDDDERQCLRPSTTNATATATSIDRPPHRRSPTTGYYYNSGGSPTPTSPPTQQRPHPHVVRVVDAERERQRARRRGGDDDASPSFIRMPPLCDDASRASAASADNDDDDAARRRRRQQQQQQQQIARRNDARGNREPASTMGNSAKNNNNNNSSSSASENRRSVPF